MQATIVTSEGVTVAYLGDIVGTISSAGTAGTAIPTSSTTTTYVNGAISFHSNKKVKSGNLKAGSIVTISSIPYELTTDVVTHFKSSDGTFLKFDDLTTEPIAVTRNSGDLTVDVFDLTLTHTVTINLKKDGTIHTTPYPLGSEIKGTLGGADVTVAGTSPISHIYVGGGSEITLYADEKVKKATLKKGSIVAIDSGGGSSINYKLKGDTTVVNFAAGGVFGTFDAASVAVTRDSGTLTVDGFTLTLTHTVTINLQSSGAIHGTTPYPLGSEIKGTLGGANVPVAGTSPINHIYVGGGSNITLWSNKAVKQATLKKGSVVAIKGTNYTLITDRVMNFTSAGVFDSFGASETLPIAVTRNSGDLTVDVFTLTLSDSNTATMNLDAAGDIDESNPYTGEIKGTLSAEVTKEGYTYKINTEITLYTNNKVKRGTLVVGTNVRNVESGTTNVRTITTIAFTFVANRLGDVDIASSLPQDVVAEVHKVPAGIGIGTPYTFKRGSIVSGSSGTITSGKLYESKSIIVGGNNYLLAKDSKVIFDASGSLIQGRISWTQYVIYGVLHTFETGGIIKRSRKGWVVQGKISETQYVIDGVLRTFVAGSVKTNGSAWIVQGKISEAQYVIRGDFFSFNSAPSFHTNGVVKIGRFASTTTVNVRENRFSFLASYDIEFHANGVVKQGHLATATSGTMVGSNSYNFKEGSSIYFYDNGVVKSGTIVLADGTTTESVSFTRSGVKN